MLLSCPAREPEAENMRTAVFEDRAAEFLPLTYTRAVFDLRTGRYTLFGRARRLLGRVDYIYVRPLLERLYREDRGLRVNPDEPDDDLLLVNPLYAADPRFAESLAKVKEKPGLMLVQGGRVAAAHLPRRVAAQVSDRLPGMDGAGLYSLLKGELDALELKGVEPIEYPWDLIARNSGLLAGDLDGGPGGLEALGEVDETVRVLGNRRVYVAERALVEPYVVLDARGGPIYVGRGAVIRSFAYVEGPAYIGPGTHVMPGARLREGSNVGPICRVGGEVEESIIHGYSNKYHDGFLGHAYVGEWVNLGALTTNSDLKNTYGTVRVRVDGRLVDTGRRKVGALIGDMAKTSIGSLIYTGKRLGVASHLHGVALTDVPSFTIYAASLGAGAVELRVESAVETQRRMMARRGLELTPALEELIRRLYEETRPEREAAGVRQGEFKLAARW